MEVIFTKAAGLQPETLLKTKLPRGSCPLSRNTYFKEHLPVSANDNIRTIDIYVLYLDITSVLRLSFSVRANGSYYMSTCGTYAFLRPMF